MTKILIVDDEEEILSSTAALLRAYGYETVTESRADLVLAALRREKPDLLLQDVRMPQLDLRSLIGAMRTDAVLAQLPVILFSATQSVDVLAPVVGANDALEKPFLPDRLLEILGKWAPRPDRG